VVSVASELTKIVSPGTPPGKLLSAAPVISWGAPVSSPRSTQFVSAGQDPSQSLIAGKPPGFGPSMRRSKGLVNDSFVPSPGGRPSFYPSAPSFDIPKGIGSSQRECVLGTGPQRLRGGAERRGDRVLSARAVVQGAVTGSDVRGPVRKQKRATQVGQSQLWS
jgi:hypothetical protein